MCSAALAMLFGTGKISAQQDPLYVQYIDNLLVVNPGFAGSKPTAKYSWYRATSGFRLKVRLKLIRFHTPRQ